MSLDVEKLLQVMYAAKEENKRAVSIFLGAALLNCHQVGEIESVNLLLVRADPERMLNTLCLTLLMSTYAHRAHYVAWEAARQRIVDTIIKREGEEQARKLLLGFVQPSNVRTATKGDESLDKLLTVHPTLVRYEKQEW